MFSLILDLGLAMKLIQKIINVRKGTITENNINNIEGRSINSVAFENFKIDTISKIAPKIKDGQAALFKDKYHLSLFVLVRIIKNKTKAEINNNARTMNPGQKQKEDEMQILT
ncbi:MAG: hypothetical protein WC750_04000 [Patescibacteria group bacterium]|jgi:hypothetical protein